MEEKILAGPSSMPKKSKTRPRATRKQPHLRVKEEETRGLARILKLEGSLQFLQRPGAWLWVLVSAGILVRAFLVIFTEGTYDVSIWKSHAQGVLDHGLVGQYRVSEALNHPPLACWVAAGLLLLSQWTGVSFGIVLRAPLALADVGTAFLLGYVLRTTRYRWAAVGLYAVHPLAIILSAYHGNTDSLIAFFILLSVALISEERPVMAAVALGVSLWIKLPGLLVAPALALGFKQWRDRFAFGATASLIGVITYIPLLLSDPGILYTRVLSYGGWIIQTTAGIRVWGLQNFLYLLQELPRNWQLPVGSAVIWVFNHNRLAVLLPLTAFAWMRRGEQSAAGLGTTVAASYAIVYAFSNSWSFQYFAWAIPFWFLTGPIFLAGATLLAGGFIYALYAFDCGSPLLLGAWDFVGHPHWPRYLLLLRDTTVVFFFVASVVFLVRAAAREIANARSSPQRG